MKKLLAVLVCGLMLAFVAAACSTKEAASPQEPHETQASISDASGPNGTEGVIDFRSGGTPRWEVPNTRGFNINCPYTKTGLIDPIVSFGAPSAHLHTIEGGTLTETSTLQTLLNSPTTCKEPTHHTAYWQPELQQQDPKTGKWEPVKIGFMHVYNRVVMGSGTANLEAPENGLKIIAGSAASTTTQPGIVDFGCSGSGDGPAGYLKPVSCKATGLNPWVKMLYRFPNCYQHGVLDSADHHSHASYPIGYPQDSSASECPNGYYETPVATMAVRYLTHSGKNLRLSSGSVDTTGHADIFWAMDRSVYQQTIKTELQ